MVTEAVTPFVDSVVARHQEQKTTKAPSVIYRGWGEKISLVNWDLLEPIVEKTNVATMLDGTISGVS